MTRISEAARERATFQLAEQFVDDAISKESARNSRPDSVFPATSSSDPALTAFAQLAAFRLKVSRALISIFDRRNQYVVAEATAASSLAPNTQQDELWLSGTAVARSWGICEHVLIAAPAPQEIELQSDGFDRSGSLPVSVVPDLGADARFCNRTYIKEAPPYNRFYAGVPLQSKDGVNIGVFCVFDTEPRAGLDDDELKFMRDIASTIMNHIELTRAGQKYRRSTRMVRGLGSFVEGKSTMTGWQSGPNAESFLDSVGGEGNLASAHQAVNNTTEQTQGNVHAEVALESAKPSSPAAATFEKAAVSTHASSTRPALEATPHASTSTISTVSSPPPSEPLGNEIHDVFGNAANIIREAIEVEGVLFLDASVGSYGGLVRDQEPELPDTDLSSSSDRAPAQPARADHEVDPHDGGDRNCSIFAKATTDQSMLHNSPSRSGDMTFPEKFLRILLRRYPKGKIFSFDEDGATLSTDSDEEKSRSSATSPRNVNNLAASRASKLGQRPYSKKSEAITLRKHFPEARSIALFPLWDSHRERWYAGGFAWSKSPTRILTLGGELSYLRAFGMTMMAEVKSIDLSQAERAKSDLLGSLSHELRSPLHGIIASAELLGGTELDAFQADVLRSVESCGRTLLDVIDHLLDYSKINRLVRSRRDESNRGSRRSSAAERQEAFESQLATLMSNVELDALVEECAESVLNGFDFEKASNAHLANPEKWQFADVRTMGEKKKVIMVESSRQGIESSGLTQFDVGSVRVFLEIDPHCTWLVYTQPGAVRRILMNLLGNSLRFTSAGFVLVRLEQVPVVEGRIKGRTGLKLTVLDSGQGISSEFLHHRVFTPFSQEDPLLPGAGLGLSIVYQITKALGGSVQIESRKGVGTAVSVTLPILPSKELVKQDLVFAEHLTELKGLRVSLRGLQTEADDCRLSSLSPRSEHEYLENLCRTWLHLDVVSSDTVDVRPDLIICTDSSLNQVLLDDTHGHIFPVVVICRSTLAGHRLSSMHTSMHGGRTFEFVSQPAGPRKLAHAMVLALRRYSDLMAIEALTPQGLEDTVHHIMPETNTAGLLDLPVRTTPYAARNDSVQSSVVPTSIVPDQADRNKTPTPEEPLADAATSHSGYVPALESSEHSVIPSEPGQASLSRRNTYLLVDDNKINIQILVAFMKKLKYSYETAKDGLEALEAYTQDPLKFSCILMDISMPVMDGLESTRRIRALEKARGLEPATVIALTGLASANVQQEAFASGIDMFMTKPVRLKELSNVIG